MPAQHRAETGEVVAYSGEASQGKRLTSGGYPLIGQATISNGMTPGEEREVSVANGTLSLTQCTTFDPSPTDPGQRYVL